MPLETFENLKARLAKGTEQNDPFASLKRSANRPVNLTTPGSVEKLKPVVYDTPNDAIYDRLSDGSYVAKFENYKGPTGNENRLAKEQSGLEQATYGLAKNVTKVASYALDATLGTAYGIFNGIKEGEMAAVWDNDVSNALDDFNKKLDYNLPNYYTDEQKSASFLKSMTTTNFWANDVAGGLAFVGGVILPEVIIGTLTGGASLGVGAGKIASTLGREGAEAISKSFGRRALDVVNDVIPAKKGRDVIRAYNAAIYGKKAGDAVSTASFLLRSSNFEAGMEARHNFKESMSNFYNNYETKNGKPPGFNELSEFTDTATKTANGLYGANLAILGVSNAVMFGKAFGLSLPTTGKQVNNFFNRAIGLGTRTTEEGLLALRGANKFQKIAGNSYKILSRPLVEGLYEEGFQGVAGRTMQKYLETKYDPNAVEGYSFWSGLHDAFSEQYSTKEGWKEMGIGMIIGFAGGAIQPGQRNADGTKQSFISKLPGLGSNSRKARQIQIEKEIEISNSGITTLRNLDRVSSLRNFQNVSKSKEEKYESFAAENAMENVTFIQSQEHLKSPSEIKKDYDTVIDHMELTNEQISELVSTRPDISSEELTSSHPAVVDYKASLKQEFAQNLKDYQFATQAVEALGLDRRVETTAGNFVGIKDAMIMNIMLGKNALYSAKGVSKQIDALISPAVYDDQGLQIKLGGIFDTLQFYNSLTQKQKETAIELKNKQKRLKTLQNLTLEYQQQIAGLQVVKPRKADNKTLDKRYNEKAKKAVAVQQEIIKLQKEVENIQNSLQDNFTAANYDLDGTLTSSSVDIVSALEELDKLNTYQNALRSNGKNYEADSLEYLIKQFKFYSDSHREMINAHRAMLDSGFFKSAEGSKLIDRLVGKKYTMSESFRQEIRDNNEVIDKSLNLAGVRWDEDSEKTIEEAIQENPDLSDREKFRLENIIRLQLNLQAIGKQVDEITQIPVEINSEKESENDPLIGDTVRLRESIVNRDLDNIDVLNNTINEIISQLDYIRTQGLSKEERENLEKQLSELKAKKEGFSKPEVAIESTTDVIQETEQAENQTEVSNVNLRTLTDIMDSNVSQEAYQILDNINFEDKNSVQQSVSEILAIINNKQIPKNQIEQVLSTKSKLIGNKDFFTKDYLEKYIGLSTKDFTGLKIEDVLNTPPIQYSVEDLNVQREEELNKIVDKKTGAKAGDNPRLADEINSRFDEQIKNLQDAVENNQEQENSSESNQQQYSGANRSQQAQEQTSQSQTDNSNISSEEKEIDFQIKQIEDELSESSIGVNYVSTPEYKRLTELMRKLDNGSITPQEQIELDELENDVDQWLLISGTVADGIRLSDLIRQKMTLENTKVTPVEEVEEVIAQDILNDINFTDRTSNVNSTFGQTYDSVTAVKDGDFISVSGIKIETLIQEVGFPFNFEKNERGNILLTEEVVEQINRESNISILPTNEDLTTNYSIVIKHNLERNGEIQSNPVQSNYNDDFTEAQKPDAIYSLSPGDELTLEVDPNDDYNKDLLDEYRNSTGVQKIPSNLSEDAIEDLIDQTQTELSEKDEEYQTLLKKEEELKAAIANADTTDKTNTARKELLKFNNSGKINKKEDQLRTKAEKFVEKQMKQRSTPVSNNEEAKEKLKRGLVIRVKDADGNFIAVLKAKSSSGNKTLDDQNFESFRDNVANDDFIQTLLDSTTAIELDTPPISVKKVFLGHPNFNFRKNDDGTVGIQYKKITPSDISKIVDIGFIEDGVLNTRSNIKGIDTTFLHKFLERAKSEKKIPFVVFEKNGRRIAYPVRLTSNAKPDNSGLTSIFNSNVDTTTKVVNLNKFLAERGVDIKKPGNAFTAIGNTNLTQEFLDQKLAQLDAIEYFSPLSEWVGSEVSVEDILSNQVLININLTNPLHSPKVQLDFKEVFKNMASEKVTVNPEQVAKDVVNKKSKDISSKALEELRKNC